MNKIHVILREWNGAINRKQNVRPSWFSYEKCYQSIKSAGDAIDLTILIDGTANQHHFKFQEGDNIIEYNGGSDPASFLFAMNTIKEMNLNDDDIVYIVEDDYYHIKGWEKIMIDAFETFDVDYVTLYDHPDKYFLPMYKELTSSIYHSKLCHWRTTPSTCNTFAMKWEILKKHWDIHEKYCLPGITHDGYDHTKFVELWKNGSNLISSIPGYSTHCEMQFLSPFIENHI